MRRSPDTMSPTAALRVMELESALLDNRRRLPLESSSTCPAYSICCPSAWQWQLWVSAEGGRIGVSGFRDVWGETSAQQKASMR